LDQKSDNLRTRVSLAALRKGDEGVVYCVNLDDAAAVGDVADSTVSRRLIELGFVPGERIHVIEEIWPGGDPMAVRVGSSVFALRRREARAVLVEVELQ
jgi:ferrous iron transport protein A